MSGQSVTLVTGGSSGIGLACATLLAQRGQRVVVWARDDDRLSNTARVHPNIGVDRVDLGVDRCIRDGVRSVLGTYGRLDNVVLNAGIFDVSGIDIEPDRSTEIFRINVLAPIEVMRVARAALVDSKGAVVAVSSTYARLVAPKEAAYAASKAALESLTRSWAAELAPHRVRVNCVAPGPTDTPILVHGGLSAESAATMSAASAARMPLGRLGDPTEVAWWITALLSGRANWVTGQTITVDGGWAVQ